MKHKLYLMRDQSIAKCFRTLSYFTVQKKLKTEKNNTVAQFKSILITSENAVCDTSVMAHTNIRLAFLKENQRAFKLTTLLRSAVAYLETHMQLVGMLTGFHLLPISSAPQY